VSDLRTETADGLHCCIISGAGHSNLIHGLRETKCITIIWGAQNEKVTAWECIPFAFDVNTIAAADSGFVVFYELRVGCCALPLARPHEAENRYLGVAPSVYSFYIYPLTSREP